MLGLPGQTLTRREARLWRVWGRLLEVQVDRRTVVEVEHRDPGPRAGLFGFLDLHLTQATVRVSGGLQGCS